MFQTVPGLGQHGISLSSICRLFNPPNSGNIASKRYKSYIDARVGSKLNSYREPHEDAHYIFARNKYRREFASMFNKSVCKLSKDDMAKVKVGPPAVSRYHQIRRYFLGADTPNMPHHDFPIPGYLLNVSGYMMLEKEKPKIDQSEDTMNIENSSVHDNNQINDQKNSEETYDLANFKEANPSGSIFEILADQCKVNLNIYTTAQELEESLFEFVKADTQNFDSYFDGSEDLKKLCDSKNSEILPSLRKLVFHAFSLYCQCKVIVFGNNGREVICHPKCSSTSPIFLKLNEKEFMSLYYKQEDQEQYSKLNLPGTDDLTRDGLGRLHLKTPCTGTINVFLRAQRFNGITAATNITNLDKVLPVQIEKGKSVVFIIFDNGPDFNPMLLLNELYYFRLFKKLNIDVLVIMTYDARYSAFNPIEHLWAPMSKALSGIILPSTLEGGTTTPAKQGKLSEEERATKERVVFNDAMEKWSQCWRNLNFDGKEINTAVIKCDEDNLLFDDYERVQAFLETSIGRLPEFEDLVKEFKDMFLHMDRHYNEVVFKICNALSCCKEWKGQRRKSLLRKTQNEITSTDSQYHI